MKPKQSFAEWAANGDHTPQGIDPKEWSGKVRKYAAGGLLKKAIKSLKGAQEILPQAEREANLAKLLEPSKIKERLYHGTTATEGGKGQEAIRRFKPSKEGALGSGVYLTPSPAKASRYSGAPNEEMLAEMRKSFGVPDQVVEDLSAGKFRPDIFGPQEGGNMLPVYAQIKNPLVLEGKGDPMIEALIKLGVDEATAGKMVERAYETKGYIGKEVESRARAAGYDGLMQYRDGNLTEVVSYNPNAIKSATGNVGTYDVTSPDLSKAGGGLLRKAIKATKDSSKATSGPAFGAWGFPDDLLRRERGSFASAFGVDYGQTLAPSFEFAPLKRLNTTEKVDEAKVRSLMNAMKESGNTLDNRIPPVIVDSAGNVLDGHHRVEAARRLGYDQVPIIEKFDRQSGPKFGDSYAEGGEVKMQDGGAAFGVFPQMKRKRTKQDPEAAKRVPLDLARGFVAGTLGLPGDVESIARLPYELITGKDTKTFLPTSEEIEAKLPLRGESPTSRLATGVGQLGGGSYTGPASGLRALTAIPKAAVKAGKDFIMAAPQGAPRMFIGPKAKTWDQAKADRAVQMEKEGKDPVDIWRETGTFRSADGILRQEISDVGAVHRNPTQLKELGKQKKEEAAELQQRLVGIPGQKDMFPKALTEAKKPAREKVKTLKEEADELMRHSDVRGQRAKFALEHPELYKAYPELGEIPVYQGNRGIGGERASIRGGPQDLEMEITQSGLRGDPRSSALHEMQHAIQTIEGMGPGGSPAMAFKNPKAFEILEELRKKALEPMSFDDYAKQYSHVPDLQQGYESYKRAIPRVVKNMDRELQQQAAMEYYKRLAGEAESRATQAREPMSASQRAQEFPYSSYDVLPEDLIVNPAKGSSISMQMGPDDYRPVKAGETIGDLTIGENISNRGSIEASGIEKVLPGVRAVPMSSFEVTAPHDLFYAKDDLDRVRALAEEIKQSGRIDPMIVGVDEKGNYILEGAHRLGALHLLGAKEFPALIAVEEGVKGFSSGGEVKMQDGGAAFGFFPQMKPRRSKQDPEAAKNVPIDLARGFVSGALGMPGDIESIVRMLPGFSEKTILPTSEDIEKRLPLRSDTPAARAATGLGQIGGGFYTGPLSGARAAVAVPKAVMQAGRDFVQAAGLPAVNVIKPKGGNWLTGNVEKQVGRMKMADEMTPEYYANRQRLLEEARAKGDDRTVRAISEDLEVSRRNDAINNWIDRNLTNYIKKEMATPEDPVRLLIERRQAEVEGKYIKDQERAQRMADRAAAETDPRRQTNLSRQAQQMRDEADLEREIGLAHLSHLPSGFGENSQLASYISASRESKGFPREGMAKTPSSKIWENLSDEAIVGARPSEISPASRNLNPWIEKLDPNESVYRTSQDIRRELGFDHIVDVLRQDLAAGRINPDQLSKVSMEQAVRRTAEFDQDMAKKMREARIKITEGMPVHKEYPEGYKWVDLTVPKLESLPEGTSYQKLSNGQVRIVDAGGNPLTAGERSEAAALKSLEKQRGQELLEGALKYEGETMGHCVGGYCPDVLEGRSRIYSLRDAKGEPHVTIEVRPIEDMARERIEPAISEFGQKGYKVDDEFFLNKDEALAYVVDDMKRFEPNIKPEIIQIKGKQNKAPKEEYLPFVQDFVRSGQWSEVGDLRNTGLRDMTKYEPLRKYLEGKGEKFDRYIPEEQFKTYEDDFLMDRLYPKDNPNYTPPTDGMRAGGEVKMQAGGIAKALKKLVGPSAEAVAKDVSAAERAAAGRMAADVTKATQPMKMSEALGNLNVEGRGKVKITQSDRTRVGGGNIGGAMFPGLSQVDPLYEGLVWGVGKKPTASSLINQSDDLTYWTTILGAEDQLKTNPLVFNKLRQGFVDAMKQGKLDKELEGRINHNLALTFGEGAEIRDPKIWKKADTFEKRAALADIMLGQGIPPSKGGVALGGEKSGKGVIFKPTDILKRETEPLLLHPEHGGDVPTFAVGPRLFQFSGGMKVRPDLHPGFPVLLEGQDLGMVFKPAPGEVAMRDFTQRMASERGRKPGYYEWTMGEKGKGLPSQDITEEYLTYLQKAGYAKGGKVGALSMI